MSGREYRGAVIDVGDGQPIVEVWDDQLVRPLTHHVKHCIERSPWAWGYGGSGPAELARSLLIDALGDDAWCRQCGGAEHQARINAGTELAEVGTCPGCFGERTSFPPDIYQRFKQVCVATMPATGWTVTQKQILDWLKENPW